MTNNEVMEYALETLREFIQDVQSGGPNIQEEWPDLHITYQHAQDVIRQAEKLNV